jgi:hypothetical protein
LLTLRASASIALLDLAEATVELVVLFTTGIPKIKKKTIKKD